MPTPLTLSLAAVFIGVAMASGLAASRMLSFSTSGRKRLRDMATVAPSDLLREETLVDVPDPALRRLSLALPKSPKEMGRLRRRLAAAGYYDLSAAVYLSAVKFGAPVVIGGMAVLLLGLSDGWMPAALGAMLGYVLPDLWLARKTRAHAKAVENGLPDALDLIIVCIEAGSSLDQAIVKASDELEITHRPLAHEMRMITTEIRAGKPRLEAFTNFAQRTKVPDVRSLVTMLTQTDRFGTSVSQALRIHAETSRTKRRQRAEERAAKIGVKLVFPLVLCIFPAVYVVCIGSAVIAIYRGLF
jgi:tight adherence protein C